MSLISTAVLDPQTKQNCKFLDFLYVDNCDDLLSFAISGRSRKLCFQTAVKFVKSSTFVF